MKKLVFSIITIFILLLIKSCANIGSPNGGPKDTTTPKVLKVLPESNTRNFNGKYILVEYNEFIDASNLEKELVIVPSIENFRIDKNPKSIKIIFEESLETNTTYQLFFGNGIKDVNEGNACKYKKLVFSTGNVIDSMKIYGTTKDLQTSTNINCFVGLYQAKKDLDVNKTKPYYFVKSENGRFVFENIKNGEYEIYAFTDLNKNKLWDKKEALAYHSTIINTKKTDTINLKTSQQNLDTLKYLSTTENKDFYQIKYSRGIKNFHVSGNQLFKINNEKILILKNKEDSLALEITANDSLDHEITNKINIKRKSSPLKTNTFINASPYNSQMPGRKYILITDRILKDINYDLIEINHDGKMMDKKEINIKRDSIYFTIPKYSDSLNISFKKGSFISVHNDSSSSIVNKYGKFDESNYGLISGKVEYNGNIVLELLKDGKVQFSTRNKHFEAKYLLPGDYFIRIIKDTDNNGYWTQGDYRNKKQPEDIYINPKTLTLKANWELKDLLIKP